MRDSANPEQSAKIAEIMTKYNALEGYNTQLQKKIGVLEQQVGGKQRPDQPERGHPNIQWPGDPKATPAVQRRTRHPSAWGGDPDRPNYADRSIPQIPTTKEAGVGGDYANESMANLSRQRDALVPHHKVLAAGEPPGPTQASQETRQGEYRYRTRTVLRGGGGTPPAKGRRPVPVKKHEPATTPAVAAYQRRGAQIRRQLRNELAKTKRSARCSSNHTTPQKDRPA